jgi:NAD(P)-dependent dehydrogenase (short-subunit alcohol dehydrogenase family)
MTVPIPEPVVPVLSGRVALVTGAGRGLGAATAEMLARAGAELVLMSRTACELEEVAARIRAAGGVATTCVCDLCDSHAMRAAVASIPRLDILVNNAGTNIPAEFIDVREEDLDKMISLSVRAGFLVAQAAVRKMLETPIEKRMPGGSAVVHVTSQMGRVGSPRRTVYCMVKHALEGLNKAMAVELAPKGIRSNSVAPTFLKTAMTEPFFARDPAFLDWVLNRIPLRRLGSVEEVARTILFLASPAASLITGESIATDGGWTAQ